MTLGILLALGASGSWALANVAVQRAGRAVGGLRALFWAQVVGGLLLLPPALALDDRLAPAASFVPWCAVAGVAALLAYSCLFVGFERGRLSVTVPIMSSWSMIAAALSIALGESLRRPQLVGAAVVAMGAVLVARGAARDEQRAASARRAASGVAAAAVAGAPDAPHGGAPDGVSAAVVPAGERAALWASVGAAVGFGVLMPAFARLSPVAGRLGAVSLVYALELALGLPLALALGVRLGPPRSHWPVVALAGVAETAGFVFISLAAEHAPMAVVSPVASLSAAMTVLFAWFALRERPGSVAGWGAALASAGVILLAL